MPKLKIQVDPVLKISSPFLLQTKSGAFAGSMKSICLGGLESLIYGYDGYSLVMCCDVTVADPQQYPHDILVELKKSPKLHRFILGPGEVLHVPLGFVPVISALHTEDFPESTPSQQDRAFVLVFPCLSDAQESRRVNDQAKLAVQNLLVPFMKGVVTEKPWAQMVDMLSTYFGVEISAEDGAANGAADGAANGAAAGTVGEDAKD